MNKGRAFKIVTIAFTSLVIAAVVFIMANGMGLSEQYDFGAGAYYYTDIPDYQKVIRDDIFVSRVPFLVHLLLFLGWGYLMYRLWVRIDKKS